MTSTSCRRQTVRVQGHALISLVDRDTIGEKYSKLLKYYHETDNGIYENFTYFNALIFEFDEHPGYHTLINRIIDIVRLIYALLTLDLPSD